MESPSDSAGQAGRTRWRCWVAYDGTDFEGWQAQPSGNAVQNHLERRLSFLCKEPIRIHGSGRTDSGVHATGQVFHFDGIWNHSAEDLLKALRTGFPDSIQVYRAEPCEADFHARYSAVGKRYLYRIFEGFAPPMETRYCWSLGHRRLDHEAMNAGAASLIGRHDFSAFGANPRDDREDDPVKELRVLRVLREGPRLTLETEASGYLYKMVRSLTGCLVDVGTGKLKPEDLPGILESRVRTNRVVTSPPQGLCLERVYYPEEEK